MCMRGIKAEREIHLKLVKDLIKESECHRYGEMVTLRPLMKAVEFLLETQ